MEPIAVPVSMSCLYVGDCLEVLKGFEDNSIDAIVTDPPYGLEFMGKEWDKFETRDKSRALRGDKGGIPIGPGSGRGTSPYGVEGNGTQGHPAFDLSVAAKRGFQEWCTEWTAECLRVLKPGGHLLAFGGTRTWHRLACAVEDAGFEMRDSLAWLYGSGFPKSLDVSKAIDKAARGVPQGGSDPTSPNHGKYRTTTTEGKRWDGDAGQGYGAGGSRFLVGGAQAATATPTVNNPDAEKWQGWGTALKPAFEPIVFARKPFKGTVVSNVLAHGTGALNIDATRVRLQEGEVLAVPQSDPTKREGVVGTDLGISNSTVEDFQAAQRASIERTQNLGRWPANVVLSHEDGCAQVGTHTEVIGGGEHATSGFVEGYARGDGFVGKEVSTPVWACVAGCQVAELDKQSGTLKSGDGNTRRKPHETTSMAGTLNTLDREEVSYGDTGGASRFFYCAKAPKRERVVVDDVAHPTVKPLALMRWLVKLVTPPDGVVLDLFAGSGTTMEAAVLEGFCAVGIEKTAEYVPLIKARMTRAGVEVKEDEGGFITFF